MTDAAGRRIVKEEMEAVLATLSAPVRQVLEFRFGLVDGVVRTVDEVAKE